MPIFYFLKPVSTSQFHHISNFSYWIRFASAIILSDHFYEYSLHPVSTHPQPQKPARLNRQAGFSVRYKSYPNISPLMNSACADETAHILLHLIILSSLPNNESSHDGYRQKIPPHQMFAKGSFCALQPLFIMCATRRRFRSIKILRASRSPWAAKAK